MEDQIPPPKALVIVAHLSEEERRETEQNGKYLYFGRYLNGKAGFQHDGHRHRQHDPGHQEDVDPLLLDGQENELRCRSEEHTSELQSLMRISYAVLCLKTKNSQLQSHQQNILHNITH